LKVIGPLKSNVQYIFSGQGEKIDKEIFIKSNLHVKVKERYSFSELTIPEDLRAESIKFLRGVFKQGSANIVIEELSVGNIGMTVNVIGESSTAIAVIDDFCKMVDEAQLFEPLLGTAPEKNFETVGRVNIDVSPEKFLNPLLVQCLKGIQSEFQKEDFDIELHPNALAVAFVFKPNLERLSRKSLNAADLSRISEVTSKTLVINVHGIDDFYNRVFRVDLDADSTIFLKALRNLEKVLS
jgi:hypothetical protein